MARKTGFVVIPAVDIRGGRCVRLRRGRLEEETVFDEDPVRAAVHWKEEGAALLHVVDLDGAFMGAPVNAGAVKAIRAAVDIPIQVGGGIRDTRSATDYVEAGIDRVIVGTAAFKDPEWLERLAAEIGEKLVVGVDVKDGSVATEGWLSSSGSTPVEAVDRLASAGVRRIVYTDVMKDGTLEGPNVSGLEAVALRARVAVIAAGGIGTIEDITDIAALHNLGVEGAITGMALYRGRFTLAEARAAVQGRSE